MNVYRVSENRSFKAEVNCFIRAVIFSFTKGEKIPGTFDLSIFK